MSAPASKYNASGDARAEQLTLEEASPDDRIAVQVAYALPSVQHRIDLVVPVGTSAASAVAASGIVLRCPELANRELLLGVWGERVGPDDVVKDGDRVEIYRELEEDPRIRRRRSVAAERAGPTTRRG